MRSLILPGILIGLAVWAQQSPQPAQTNPTAPGTTPAKDSAAKKPKTKSKVVPPSVPLPFPAGTEPATTEQYERARKNAARLSKEPAGVKGATEGEPETILRNRRRYALIIANQEYHDLEKLHSPRVDAEALVDVLASDGFIVQVFFDLDHQKFQETLDRFEQNLRPDDFAFFYYTGHAIEVNGINILLPVDFKKSDVARSRLQGIPLETVRELFGRADRPRMLVLDSCRTSPVPGTKSATAQQAETSARNQEALVFSTSENGNAFDGSGWSRSLFSRALTHALRQKEIGLKQAVQLARLMVLIFSNGRQKPQVTIDSGFKDASLWPEGTVSDLAHTDLRDYVGVDFARDESIVKRVKSSESKQPPVGDAEHVLTLTGDWTAATHTPIADWSDDRRDRAIGFLEERLDIRALTPENKNLWDKMKKALGPINTFWLCESLMFRRADLPAAIERVPPEMARELNAGEPKKRSFASVRGILGLMDALTLSHAEYAGLKKHLPAAVLMVTDLSFEDFLSFLGGPMTSNGTYFTTEHVCALAALDQRGCNLKFHSLAPALAKLDPSEIWGVVFLLEMSLEYRVPLEWWLPSEGIPSADWSRRLALGIQRASLARLRQDPVLQGCSELYKDCPVIAADDDPLDPIAAFSRSPTPGAYFEVDTNSWYVDKSEVDDLTAEQDLGLALVLLPHNYNAWGARNQRSREGRALPRGFQLYTDSMADCRASVAWQGLNQEISIARSQEDVVAYLRLELLLANGLFDLTALRHYDTLMTQLDSRPPGLSCWIEILQGDSPFSQCKADALPALTPEAQMPSEQADFDVVWLRIFSLELAGDSQSADAEIELARQWSKITDGNRISQSGEYKDYRRQRVAEMEHIVAAMRGKEPPGERDESLTTLIPDIRISSKCGMPQEIR